MKRTSWFALALTAVVAVTTAFAQQRPYFESFEVRLHNLDVVVTDRNGKHVEGLTQEDFILLENGVEQSISNFGVFDSTTSKASSATSQSVSAETPSHTPRRFIFFVDDMSLRKPVRDDLIANANALLDELQPGDLTAVVRPFGSDRMPQPFTADTAAARKVLSDAIESCKVSLTASEAAEYRTLMKELSGSAHEGDRAFAQLEYGQRSQDRVQQRLGQLRAMVASMADIQGRKVIVLLTDGLPSIPRFATLDGELNQTRDPFERVFDWGGQGDLNPLIDELARLAAANGVTIYALEPQVPLARGLRLTRNESPMASASLVNDTKSRQRPIVSNEIYSSLMHYRAQTLRSLSEKTGGTWSRGVGTIEPLFEQVASDFRSYYSLAYRATGERGVPRDVAVKVRNRPDLNVRTRTEVVDRAPEREMNDLVTSTILFPRDVNELRMSLEAGTSKRGKSTVYVPINVVIPLETLTFLPGDEGKYIATVDIHYATSGLKNGYMRTGRHEQIIEITEEQYKTRAGASYRFKSGVEVFRGPTRIAIGVMDRASHLVGFKTVDVDAQ